MKLDSLRLSLHHPAVAPPVPASRPPRLLAAHAALSSWRLDRQLAAGVPSASSRLLAARARRLAEPATRRMLARSLRRAVVRSMAPTRRSPVVAADPRLIAGWADGLLGIAERLERPEPLATCAVARVRLLVGDGTGPLYSDRAERTLGEAIWAIADALQAACPPHQWGCPVITKLDPDHVAWTCAGCGAVAYSPHLGCTPD